MPAETIESINEEADEGRLMFVSPKPDNLCLLSTMVVRAQTMIQYPYQDRLCTQAHFFQLREASNTEASLQFTGLGS